LNIKLNVILNQNIDILKPDYGNNPRCKFGKKYEYYHEYYLKFIKNVILDIIIFHITKKNEMEGFN